MDRRVVESEDIALAELLDRVVEKGVVLAGDVTISVADIDLIYVGLRVLIRSALIEPPQQRSSQRDPVARGRPDGFLDDLRLRNRRP